MGFPRGAFTSKNSKGLPEGSSALEDSKGLPRGTSAMEVRERLPIGPSVRGDSGVSRDGARDTYNNTEFHKCQ